MGQGGGGAWTVCRFKGGAWQNNATLWRYIDFNQILHF